jgi:predicted DNA-binding protein
MTKKLYPSQERYLKDHPTVSFRLTREKKAKLDNIVKATGKPLSQWMSDFILNKMAPYEENSKLLKKITMLEEQKKELASERRFNIPCCYCGEPMYFSSNVPEWKTEIYPDLKKTFGTWHHTTCKPK